MKKRTINISFKYNPVDNPSYYWYKSIVNKILKTLNEHEPVELNLVIIDNEQMKQINRMYRGIDDTTDVLSFSYMHDSDQNKHVFILPPDEKRNLGEVAISFERVLVQAAEQGHSVEEELKTLVVHGVLHLFGYDHERYKERIIMNSKEREVLKVLNSA